MSMPTTTTNDVLHLTTTFAPPSSCISDIYRATSACRGDECDHTWLNLGPASTAECLPSGWAPSAYFSPGLCPSGYAASSSVEYTTGTVTETRATCCPVAHGRYSLRPHTSSTYPWYATEVCQFQPTAGVTVFNYTYLATDGSWTSATGSLDSDGLVNAYGVPIRWQSTDFTTPTPTETSKTSSVRSSLPSSEVSEGDSSGLSPGAKAGIGVGVAVGAILLITLVAGLICFRRRARRAKHNLVADGTTHDYHQPPTELESSGDIVFAPPKAELSSERHSGERTSRTQAAELDAGRPS
ncbi:hypothetical protein ETB97_007404 [Aspergillus alliaceus]|uniref:Uncharacterized protein n=1 Tax=Petromyces alliaceus TaxID=209559 RepID=A0A8H6E9N8_PETAA|nr:hypothetical protein ETB97_007404 [Aspergillus burnettii]